VLSSRSAHRNTAGDRSILGWLRAICVRAILPRPIRHSAADCFDSILLHLAEKPNDVSLAEALLHCHSNVNAFFPGKEANYEGIGTLCYQGAEHLVASAKGRHQGPNKAQVRASEDWIVVSMNHKHAIYQMSLIITLALKPNKLFVLEFVMGACFSATCVSW
jgi:hypothetical protein